jgi:hypothetical protein
MRGLRKNVATMDERAARRVRNGPAYVAGHKRRRDQVLVALLDWPNGTGPVASAAPLYVLQALKLRGLVEVRFHLSADGRREAVKLADAPDA